MKSFLIGAVFLLAPFFSSSASFWDSVVSHPPVFADSFGTCPSAYQRYPSECSSLMPFSSSDSLCDYFVPLYAPDSTNSTVGVPTSSTMSSTGDVTVNVVYCNYTYKTKSDGIQRTSQYWKQVKISSDIPTCPNSPFVVLVTSPSGQICVSSLSDISSKDSCSGYSQNEPLFLQAGSNVSSNVCYQKPDGSYCLLKRDSVNGFDYYTDSRVEDSGGCYADGNQVPDYQGTPPDIPPSNPDSNCSNIGNNVLACSTDKSNACTYSVDGYLICDQACGTVNGQFFCFRDDANGDGIPDSGISQPDDYSPNPFNPDSDGDGVPDIGGLATGVQNVVNAVGSQTSVLGQKLDGIADKLDGLDSGSVVSKLNEIINRVGTEPNKGKFPEYEEDYQQAIDDFKTKMEDVKGDFLARFPSLDDNGLGSFSGCETIAVVLGRSYQFCYDDFSGSLRIISLAVLVICSLIAVFIIVR